MMLKGKWEAIPYRIKILLELTIMSVLPVLLFTCYSYYIIRVDMIDKLDLMSSRRAEKVQERIDRVLESIWESYFEILITESLNNVMTQDISYQDYSIYSDAINRLEGQIYLRDYIRGFSFINLETDWVLSNRGMYPFSEANNREEILALLEGEYHDGRLINSTKMVTGKLHHSTVDVEGVFMLFQLPVASDSSKYIVIVNLNMDAFEEFADDQDGYEITVLDKKHQLLMTTENATADYLVKHMDTVKEESWVRLPDKRRVRISSVSTESDYFQYIVTYDNELVGEEGKRIISFAAVLIAVLLATGMAVIFTGKSVYHPILKLTDRISNMIQSEKKEKDDAIRFIEDNIQNMVRTIKSQKSEMVKFLMSRLLSGTIQEEEIQYCLKELKLKPFPDYCIMALGLSMNREWNQEMERNVLLKAVEEGMMQELSEMEIFASRVWNKALMLLIGAPTVPELYEKLGRIERFIQNYLKENGIEEMQLGASQVYHSLEYTMRGSHEAMEAMKVSGLERTRRGSSKLIMYSDIAQSIRHPSFYPEAVEIRMYELVDECREKEACMTAEHFVDELYENRISGVERRYYLYRLLFVILEVLDDAGLFISEIKLSDDSDLLVSFSQLYESGDIKNFLVRQIIPDVIEKLQQFRSTHTLEVRDKVLKMIRETKGDITLTECAEKLNYSPNYLGRLLRCENNDSFSDYVAEQKLAYARQLLEETECSVTDIARELNYANTQNFIRFFNKKEGITPGRYRQNKREEASRQKAED